MKIQQKIEFLIIFGKFDSKNREVGNNHFSTTMFLVSGVDPPGYALAPRHPDPYIATAGIEKSLTRSPKTKFSGDLNVHA